MSSTLLRTLRAVLLASMTISVLPVCNTLSSERAVIRALEASDYLCVVLWLPGSEAWQDSPWRFHLPFPVQVWTSFGDEQVEQMKKQHALSRKMLVAVPYSTEKQKVTIQERLLKDVTFVPLVRFLFVLNNGEDVPLHILRGVSCLLTFANETNINAPYDSFWNCSERRTIKANDMFVGKSMTRWGNMKGKSFIGFVEFTNEKTGRRYPIRSPFRSALEGAYRVLNITFSPYISKTIIWHNDSTSKISLDLLEKKYDVVMFPAPCSEVHARFIDAHSFTHVVPLGFYSTKKRRRPALLGFGSGSLNISWYIGCCFILVLTVYHLQGRMMNRPTSFSSLALLLYAAVLARSSDEPGSYHHTVCRILLGSWLLATLFISMNVQSDLTSEVSVPTVSKPIETVDELEHLTRTGKTFPCVEARLFEHEYVMLSRSGVLKTLKTSMMNCGDSCLEDNKTLNCFEKVGKGTHVLVWLYRSGALRKRMPRFELYPGKDFLATFPLAFMTSKAFPYVREHNRLTRTLLETGLFTRFSRRLSTFTPNTTPIEMIEVSVWNYALLYGCGCLVSALFFVIELAITVFK